MKRLTAAALSTLLLAGFALAQDENKPVRRERAERQQKRIAEGVKDGTLTKKEAVKLEMKQGALANEVRDQKKDGGGLTAREKYKINEKQDKLSKEIYKDKHDRQNRKK